MHERKTTLVDRLIRGTLVLVCSVPLALRRRHPAGQAAMELGQEKHFDIPPQQLPAALLKFSEQSGVQVTSPGQLVEGKKSPGVVGTFNPARALALLLKDTSLNYDVVDGNTVVIIGSGQLRGCRATICRKQAPRGTPRCRLRTAGSSSSRRPPRPMWHRARTRALSARPTLRARRPISSGSLEEVIVTGSSIKRIDGETALPVQVLRRDDIERTGATSAEELFKQLSAASSSGTTVAAQATGYQTGAISTISLRGLGSGRTLVLINGRRSAVYGGGSAGAAGLLGRHQLHSARGHRAGRDPQGRRLGDLRQRRHRRRGQLHPAHEFPGRRGQRHRRHAHRQGGGQQETSPSSAAWATSSATATTPDSASTSSTTRPLMGSARAFATRYSPGYGNDVTSSLRLPGQRGDCTEQRRHAQPECCPNCGPYSHRRRQLPDAVPLRQLALRLAAARYEKVSVMFNGRLAVADTSQLYTDDSFSQVRRRTTVQPVPLSYQNPLLPSNPYIAYLANLLATQYPAYHNPASPLGTGGFLLPPSSPYYPTAFAAANGINGQPLNLIYRDFANGPRHTRDTADTMRVVVGFKGDTAGWDFDTSVLYSQVQVKEDLLAGYRAVLEDHAAPRQRHHQSVRPHHRPDGARGRAGRRLQRPRTSSPKPRSPASNGRVSRDLFDLPAGPLGAAGRGIAPRDVRVRSGGGDPDRRHRRRGRQPAAGVRLAQRGIGLRRSQRHPRSRGWTPTPPCATTTTRAWAAP